MAALFSQPVFFFFLFFVLSFDFFLCFFSPCSIVQILVVSSFTQTCVLTKAFPHSPASASHYFIFISYFILFYDFSHLAHVVLHRRIFIFLTFCVKKKVNWSHLSPGPRRNRPDGKNSRHRSGICSWFQQSAWFQERIWRLCNSFHFV